MEHDLLMLEAPMLMRGELKMHWTLIASELRAGSPVTECTPPARSFGPAAASTML